MLVRQSRERCSGLDSVEMAEIELLEGVAELPRDEWNALVGDESPFLEWEWLASLEESGAVGSKTGWGPRPLIARQDGKLVAACPLYAKGHSQGEFVFDWAGPMPRSELASTTTRSFSSVCPSPRSPARAFWWPRVRTRHTG